jgi:thiol:disulfide interchange protein DsbA
MIKALFVSLALVIFAATASATEFRAGEHYELITPPLPTANADKVEVVELFWYGCPHCFAFEPSVEEWLAHKPDYVEFVRMPAVFARQWEVHARAFYAAQQLGVLDLVHRPLFEALHLEKRRIFTEDQLAEFFGEHGVSEEEFRAAFDSFDVDTRTRQAISLTRSYGISGVPSIIVNGKYRTSAQQAGTYEQLLKLVDFLADKEHDR